MAKWSSLTVEGMDCEWPIRAGSLADVLFVVWCLIGMVTCRCNRDALSISNCWVSYLHAHSWFNWWLCCVCSISFVWDDHCIGLPLRSRSIQVIVFNTLMLPSVVIVSSFRGEVFSCSWFLCCIINHCCKMHHPNNCADDSVGVQAIPFGTCILAFLLAKLQMGADGSNAVCNGGTWWVFACIYW